MSFHGKPAPEAEPAPLRTYTFKKWNGTPQIVKAHYLQFAPGHVNFWQTRPDDKQDSLVLSEANANIHTLKEVKEA